jgi:hypothetical protein
MTSSDDAVSKMTQLSRMPTTGDYNNNTGHGSCERYSIIQHIDNSRRPAHDSILGIKLGFAGHMTRSRLLIGLLASVCLTFCSLLTRCMPVTTLGDGSEGCRTEVKVEVIGQLRRLTTVKNYEDGHQIEKTHQLDFDSSRDSR